VFFHGSKRTTVSSENASGTFAMARRFSSTANSDGCSARPSIETETRSRESPSRTKGAPGVPRAGLRAILSVERIVTCAVRMSTSSEIVETRNAGGV
jgi:hypothetical protein